MNKDFYMGMALGLVGGAIAVANSFKLRRAVKDGQEQVMTAINKMGNETKSQKKDENLTK